MDLITVNQFNNEVNDEIENILFRNTIQFFRTSDKYGVESHGSGTLFKFEDSYFVLTASHNFVDENLNQLTIQAGDDLHFFNKEHTVGINKDTYNRNKIDIAIIKLKHGKLLDDLLNYKAFIELKDMDFHAEQKILKKQDEKEVDYYFLFGFPASKTDLKIKKDHSNLKKKYFKIIAYCQMEYLENKIPNKLIQDGFTNHLFFNKNKKGADKNFKGRIIKPKQNGMSGCGLWEVYFNVNSGKVQTKQVGIFTEFQRGFGISVKIKFAIELIRESFNLKRLPKFKTGMQFIKGNYK